MSDYYSVISIRSALNGITHLFPHERCHGYLRMFSENDERSVICCGLNAEDIYEVV